MGKFRKLTMKEMETIRGGVFIQEKVNQNKNFRPLTREELHQIRGGVFLDKVNQKI